MQIKQSYDVVPADELPEESGTYFVLIDGRPFGNFYYNGNRKYWEGVIQFTHWLRPRTYYVVDGVLYESEQQAWEKIGKYFDAGSNYGSDLAMSIEWAENPEEPNKDEYIQSLINNS